MNFRFLWNEWESNDLSDGKETPLGFEVFLNVHHMRTQLKMTQIAKLFIQKLWDRSIIVIAHKIDNTNTGAQSCDLSDSPVFVHYSFGRWE